jgi:hypothetical protein
VKRYDNQKEQQKKRKLLRKKHWSMACKQFLGIEFFRLVLHISVKDELP